MWTERLRRIFGRTPVPREARDLVAGANTTKEILQGLDELITRNEVELEDLHREVEGLEKLEAREVEAIQGGRLGARSQRNALRKVQRLRKQMDNVEDRVRIHDSNIHLLIQLVGKIQAIESMEMRGVGEEEIDSILVDFESQLEEYTQSVQANDIAATDLAASDLSGEKDLAALEAEILQTSREDGGRDTEPERAASGPARDVAKPDETPAAPARREPSPRREPPRRERPAAAEEAES